MANKFEFLNIAIKYIFSFIFILSGFSLLATHNRAGEITYREIDELTIEATVTTYTKATSAQVDRDSLFVEWGDNTGSYVKRILEIDLGNNVKKNVYTSTHVYPGRATYTISMTDPNRVAEIQNLNFPNSENIKFHIFITFTFTNQDFNGSNSSVILKQDPIDIACLNQPFIHIPGAYDADDDSLVFELTTPRGENGEFIFDYQLPNKILPSPDNTFTIDKTNGQITWASPKKTGEYNVAILIKEYRNGFLLNTMIRDMQIFVLDCDNKPPFIESPDEICVIAGEKIEFEITVTDPDIGQKVFLEANGGPFEITPNTPILDGPGGYANVPFTAKFTWDTKCEDIRKNPYEIVLRAVDNGLTVGSVNAGLAYLKSVNIKIVGPAPENLIADSDKNNVYLEWDKPYQCEVTENMFFQGFSVWRIDKSIDIPFDKCDPGIDGKGYKNIGSPSINIENGKYVFTDGTPEKGITYCYRVVAEFAKLSPSGNPFNFIQSLVSNEICIQLRRDIPLLTKASIVTTDIANGEIELSWIKPNPIDLDTLENPGPYKYQLQRADGINGTNFQNVPGASFSTLNFGNDVVFTFNDIGIDTETRGYNYRVAFFANGTENFYDNSPSSSTVFLNIFSSDQLNLINWESQTSWTNFMNYIYRFDIQNNNFEFIDSTNQNIYNDTGLINGEEYCYIIETKGSYLIPELDFVINNFSNESCGVPLDTIPPCTPVLQLKNACEEASQTTPEEEFTNTLTWSRIDFSCTNSSDVVQYNIYFKYNIEDEFILLEEIKDIEIISINHKPETGLTACYAISAVDSIGNESDLSLFLCIEDCPSYILPNAFTPNGDGFNDQFIPILNRFVTRIKFEVYNEWGQKVFETTDPQINWNGTNFSGAQLADGVYYYTCEVYQNSANAGEFPFDFLKGSIQILKSN